jgi:hypothetical protein
VSQALEAVNALERSAVVPLGTSSLPCPQQLELLRDRRRRACRQAIHIVRGRGRPKGALNKRSKKVADYYVQRYGDPLDAIGQLANTPLRQLIEVLMEADGSAEREARLLEGVDQAVEHSSRCGVSRAPTSRTWPATLPTRSTSSRSPRAGSAASPANWRSTRWRCRCRRISARQNMSTASSRSLDHRKSADVVILAPEMLQEHNIDPAKLAEAIATGGLEALDADSLRMITAQDGEFSEVEPGE